MLRGHQHWTRLGHRYPGLGTSSRRQRCGFELCSGGFVIESPRKAIALIVRL